MSTYHPVHMNKLGLDIGTSHTKIVEVYDDGKSKYLIKFAIFPSHNLMDSITEGTYDKSKEPVQYFKKILNEGGFTANQVHVTLPDYRIVTKVLELPYLEDQKDIQHALELNAEEHLPQPVSETVIKFTVINKFLIKGEDEKTSLYDKAVGKAVEKKGKMDVLLVAAPKKLVDNYMMFLAKSGLEVLSLEPNSLSSSRIVEVSEPNVPTILVSFGSSYVDLIFIVGGNVRFVRNIKYGVNSLVKALVDELNLSYSQAQNYLYTYGFDQNQMNGKIREILSPVTNILIQELSRFQEYVEQRINFAAQSEPNKVKRIAVSGGGSLIPNLMLYMIETLGLEVLFVDPWKIVNIEHVEEKNILKIVSPIFSSSVGCVIQ